MLKHFDANRLVELPPNPPATAASQNAAKPIMHPEPEKAREPQVPISAIVTVLANEPQVRDRLIAALNAHLQIARAAAAAEDSEP